ncbi:MAG: DMT family transporter [Beijerinckiaceae bacterium]
METHVFFAVLAAAALHASWNAVIKVSNDAFISLAIIGVFAGVVALPMAFYFGLPASGSWAWLLASLIIHLGYYVFLGKAYKTGDLGIVYPIARGVAPLLTTIAGTLFFGETVSGPALVGICFIIAGVLILSLVRTRGITRIDNHALMFAFLTACTVSAYTFADGFGARASANAHGYIAWLFVTDGLAIGALAYFLRGRVVIDSLHKHWRVGLFGGGMALAAYWIAIWAMTVAPIPLVAALRETSVMFAALISAFILKEGVRISRLAAAFVVVVGVGILRLV